MSNYDAQTGNEVENEEHSSKVLAIRKKGKYSDLDNFRKQLDQEGNTYHHRPLTLHKKKAFSYRIIFSFIGLLFMFLMTVISLKTSFTFNEFYFEYGVTVKAGVRVVCVIFSLTSLILA